MATQSLYDRQRKPFPSLFSEEPDPEDGGSNPLPSDFNRRDGGAFAGIQPPQYDSGKTAFVSGELGDVGFKRGPRTGGWRANRGPMAYRGMDPTAAMGQAGQTYDTLPARGKELYTQMGQGGEAGAKARAFKAQFPGLFGIESGDTFSALNAYHAAQRPPSRPKGKGVGFGKPLTGSMWPDRASAKSMVA